MLEILFVPAVQFRTEGCLLLISDYYSAQRRIIHDQVQFCALPPNCTSLSQPLHVGVPSSVMRRFMPRLLLVTIKVSEKQLLLSADGTTTAPANGVSFSLRAPADCVDLVVRACAAVATPEVVCAGGGPELSAGADLEGVGSARAARLESPSPTADSGNSSRHGRHVHASFDGAPAHVQDAAEGLLEEWKLTDTTTNRAKPYQVLAAICRQSGVS